MKVVRSIANAALATVGGSLAGGAAGGATIALISAFPTFSNAGSAWSGIAGFVIYLFGVAAFAFLGLIGGLMLGLIPTLLLGSLLVMAWPLGPVRLLWVWAITGAIAGIAVYRWSPYGAPPLPHSDIAWGAGWAVAGAVSMSVFWAFRRTRQS